MFLLPSGPEAPRGKVHISSSMEDTGTLTDTATITINLNDLNEAHVTVKVCITGNKHRKIGTLAVNKDIGFVIGIYASYGWSGR